MAKVKTLYEDLTWEELVKKFEDMLEAHDTSLLSGDKNMAKGYMEQCDFIYKELRKRGFRRKHYK